ncbi:hypothetical protein LZ30DRAFT_741906 [Colletotrichum cereale]|nr:hypothetical protein LZ30DRAFT_741906 [Colletotrichum cereale]
MFWPSMVLGRSWTSPTLVRTFMSLCPRPGSCRCCPKSGHTSQTVFSSRYRSTD